MNQCRKSVDLTEPIPLAHQHIFAVLNTLLENRGRRIRVLDIGCGDGGLISHFQQAFALHFPGCVAEIHGFDVAEQGYRNKQQMQNAVRRLRDRHPEVAWDRRIKSWPSHAEWDYEDGFFDVAVSNQVLEHVPDLSHFLQNLKRCLKPGGLSVHFFPLQNHIVEAHTNMPFVHYIRDFRDRVAYATLLNKLGLSRFRKDREILGSEDPAMHALDAAKFIQGFTMYRNFRDFHRHCNRNQLSLSHEFTKDFYLSKLRQMLGQRQKQLYSTSRAVPFVRSLLFFFLKYVSSVTLVMESIDYDIGERINREKAHRSRGEGSSITRDAA